MLKANEKMGPAGVYLVTDDSLDTAQLVSTTEAALRSGIGWLQYRNKRANARQRIEQATELRALTHVLGVRFIMNDSARLAAAVGADGVHLGRGDGSISQARALLGPQAIIGVSAYSYYARARRAWALGANYVAFGAVFASSVKPNAPHAALGLIERACQDKMHAVAIGGVNATNMAQVVRAGAHAVAVISAVYDAADPASANTLLVRAFQETACTAPQ